jgi:hypothetical protein
MIAALMGVKLVTGLMVELELGNRPEEEDMSG